MKNRVFLFSYQQQYKPMRDQACSSAATTKEKIQSRLKELDAFLEKQVKNVNNDDVEILLACEDFFDSFDKKNMSCFDLATTYEMLATDFISLSNKYSNLLICPGSFYISVPIVNPPKMCKFYQEGTSKINLESTVCYVSNVMPVLYNGKLLRIIRKGEKIQTVSLDKHKKNPRKIYAPIDDIENLTDNTNLEVISYHEDELVSLFDLEDKKSMCYLGKTLLPGERSLITKHFLDNDEIFSHEFTINDKKFCALICGEFNLSESKLGKSTVGNLLSKNQYEYVLHSTIGGDISSDMYKRHKYYIHADKDNDTQLYINGENCTKNCDKLITSILGKK